MSETLSPDTTIAQYTIVSKIGEGGMGVVYRARDPKLGRDVAIKVLPTSMSENVERLNRFEQEAQAAGALNHPNILSIYHIGTHDGAPYIVSELLEGETLRDRLAGGALPQRKATDYALQIAKGLAAAHEKGIVHRDIKPENIFVTDDGRVKILDFGLAKLTVAVDGVESQSNVPTRKVNTNPGTVMGTLAYMSPEQLKGDHVDHRSDIFSLGAILYELLSGERPFRGNSTAETMSAILREDPPDLSETNKSTSPALERLVRHCLEKNPGVRFYSARDLAFALESLSGSTSGSGQTTTMPALTSETNSHAQTGVARFLNNARLWMAIAALLLLVSFTWAFVYFTRSFSNTRAVRLAFAPPRELAFNDTVADSVVISPDGQKLVFSATGSDGKTMLYVRDLASSEARLLPGSENGLEPFWSPDSRSIAFGSNGKLKRSDLNGANAQVLCDSARMVGGTWNKNGVIVFAPDYRTALLRISAQGGEPKQIYNKSDLTEVEKDRFPYFLPDGQHFLFYREPDIWVGSLNSPEIKRLVTDAGVAIYVSTGWLIFLRNDALLAQPFDAKELTLTGEPIPIITGEKNSPNLKRFSVSDTGVLVWQPLWQRDYQLLWFDREGKQIGAIDAPTKVSTGEDPSISPDGKRLLVKKERNLWVIDLEKGTGLRLTSSFSQIPVWSPDGTRVVYSRGGLAVMSANGSGDEETLLERTAYPNCWSPDGRFIIFSETGVKTRMDIWALPMFGDKKAYQLSNSPFDERSPQLSRDGRWLAYSSDETGDYEIYVQSFSAEGSLGSAKKRVSTSGGRFPVWRHDGKELYYVAADGSMMATSVKTGGNEFEFESPKSLFKTRILPFNFHEFDVSHDGQRFLIGTRIGEPNASPPTVILNWTELVKP